MSRHSCAVRVTVYSNGSIIPTSFKFTELYTLTLAARSYALLWVYNWYLMNYNRMTYENVTSNVFRHRIVMAYFLVVIYGNMTLYNTILSPIYLPFLSSTPLTAPPFVFTVSHDRWEHNRSFPWRSCIGGNWRTSPTSILCVVRSWLQWQRWCAYLLLIPWYICVNL